MNYNIINYKWRLKVENLLDKTIGFLLFQYKKRDNMFNFFYNSLVYQHVTCAEYSPKYSYYEFGVAGGGSMEIYILALKQFCRKYKFDLNKFHIYAFDSFAGLPARTGESDSHLHWDKGLMVHQEDEVLKKIRRQKFPRKNFHIIKGFYENSLTDDLRKRLTLFPPSLINIDCDYYSSTATALEWLAPFLGSGAIFRFDDIWAFHGNTDYGELKAINEFNRGLWGQLTPFPICGLASYVYIYFRKEFEYGTKQS